jgi:hypothetical protein
MSSGTNNAVEAQAQAQAKADSASKVIAPAGVKEAIVLEIASDGLIFQHLSRQAKEELQTQLSDFSVVVLREAQSLESRDRASGAEPDISRAHIQEAWFNARRRLRRDRVGSWGVLVRSLYTVCIFVIGVGISHTSTTWGVWLAIGGALLGGISIAALVALKADS